MQQPSGVWSAAASPEPAAGLSAVGQLSANGPWRWDGRAWVAAPPRSARYRSAATRRTWAIVLLGAWILFAVLMVAAEMQRLTILDQLIAGGFVSKADALASDNFVRGASALQLVTYIGAGIAFLMWLYRAVANNAALGAAGSRFTPGGAVGWWFVPVANMIRPEQVVEEAWRGASTAQRSTPTTPAAMRSPTLVRLWWGAWSLNNVMAVLVVLILRTQALPALHDATVARIAGQAVGIIAAILAIAVVVKLTAGQKEAASGPPLVAVPAPPPVAPPRTGKPFGDLV